MEGKAEEVERAKTVSLRIEPDLWENLEQIALSLGFRNRNQMIRAIAKRHALVSVEGDTAGSEGKFLVA